VIVTIPAPPFVIAPPLPVLAVLLVKVLSVIVRIPLPPPALEIAPPLVVAVLSSKVLLVIVVLPVKLTSAPPNWALGPLVKLPVKVLVKFLGAPAQALIRGSIPLSAGQSVLKKRMPRGVPSGTLRGVPDPATEATRARETAAV